MESPCALRPRTHSTPQLHPCDYLNRRLRCRSALLPQCLPPTTTRDEVRDSQRRNWSRNYFRHQFDVKKSFVPTSVLGMARARDILRQSYFFTKLTALNSRFAYFLYNSIIGTNSLMPWIPIQSIKRLLGVLYYS